MSLKMPRKRSSARGCPWRGPAGRRGQAPAAEQQRRVGPRELLGGEGLLHEEAERRAAEVLSSGEPRRGADLHAVELQVERAHGVEPERHLALTHGEARRGALDDERPHPGPAGGLVDLSEHDEGVRPIGVQHEGLHAAEDPVVPRAGRGGAEPGARRVRARLAPRHGATAIGRGQLAEPLGGLRRCAQLVERARKRARPAEGERRGGVAAGEGLVEQDGGHEAEPRAAVRLGDSDATAEAHLERGQAQLRR
jgi:hypothetical protein